MLFKNLVFARLPEHWSLSAAELEGQLAGRILRPCGPFDMSTKGWVPVTHGGRLLHTVGNST
jgi:DNA recombination-dependent growth factor C